MQKKLIALAVAAAFAAPMAASAEVTIYGGMHYSWDWVDTSDAAGDDSDDITGADRSSKIGFKGSEDLGDGLSAIWQIEGNVASGVFANRNTWVGLKGSWGQVRMGRHDTPYKIATGINDVFGDQIGDYNALMNRAPGGTIEIRAPQTVAYLTPNFNGFSGAIARVSAKLNEGAGNDEVQAWSMMGMYANGPITVSAAYQTWEDGATAAATPATANLTTGVVTAGTAAVSVLPFTTATQGADAYAILGNYSFGNSKIGLSYENIEPDANGSAADRDLWGINFTHKFGANTFKIAYTAADDANNTNNGADLWAIGVDHNFSKRTVGYVAYASMDNDSAGTYGLYTGSTAGTGGANSGAGNDVDGFSLGLKHSF